MRRLRCPCEWPRGEILFNVCGAGRGRKCSDNRRPCKGWKAPSRPGSLPRQSWPAVRLLHTRHDHDCRRHDPPQTQARSTDHPSRARRQYLPLHRLSQHCQCNRRCCQAHERRRLSMVPYAFKYARAKSIDDAVAQLKRSPDAKLLAGGQTLIAAMKLRLANPSELIDISGIKELSFIRKQGDTLVIGAGTKHAEVATSPDVIRAIPALAALAGVIGDPAVRHMGTLGG